MLLARCSSHFVVLPFLLIACSGKTSGVTTGSGGSTGAGGTTHPTSAAGGAAGSDAASTATGGSVGTGGAAGIAGATGGSTGMDGATGVDGSTSVTRKKNGIGVGLNGITDWSTEFPFLDLVKQSRWWGPKDGDDKGFDYDANHWVKSVGAGQEVVLIFLTAGGDSIPHPWNRYVVRWKGKGTFEYTWGTKKVGAASGGDVVQIDNGMLGALRLLTQDPTDYIRDITVVPEPLVAAHDGGAVFNPTWIDKVKAFRTLRFMDWMQTNGSTQTTWTDRPKPTDVSWAPHGVPVEIMVRLANEINADPWFTMPAHADDDYQTQFATHVKNNLQSHLVATVEYSNEMWNWGFEQAGWGTNQAKTVLGMDGGTGWMQFSGMRAAQTCDLWKKGPFAGQTSRIQCVMGAFTGWKEVNEDMITCPAWVAKGNEPCHKHGIDAYAVTGYFTGCLNPDEAADIARIRSWFADPDKGVAKGVSQALDGKQFTCADTAAGAYDTYVYHKALATKYGLTMTMYEGGSHITGNGHAAIANDQAFIDFHLAVNRAPGMKDVYLRNYKSYRDAGGTLFMQFVDISSPSKFGSWGALEHLGQSTSPKWEALQTMLADTCAWPGCE